MKLTDQVCSLKLSKKLAKLGVKQDNLFKWVKYSMNKKPMLIFIPTVKYQLECLSGELEYSIPAYTVAELGEMLPNKVKIHNTESCLVLDRDKKTWGVAYAPFPDTFQEAKTEADARAKLLIYLLENKIISLDKINETQTK